MKLVVGIGNPGKRYEGTRHNVGFDIIDLLARRMLADPAREKFRSLVTDGIIGNEKILLAQPRTFVNESGNAVRRAVDWFDLELDDLLIVCDDFSLPLGSVRLRRGGGSGGHNGLKSVARHLGTDTFPRLRVGIGEVPVAGRNRMDPADFVLSRFLPEELDHVKTCRQRAADAVEAWIRDGIAEAMNVFN